MVDVNVDMVKMGKRIRMLREELGWSQKQLAEEVGVAQNTIAQYEKGTAKTSIDVLTRLTVVLKTTADFLLGI